MKNIKLILEYDGTCYCGWQRQINGLTIQEVLEENIGIMTGEKIRVTGSGRTDAGVHAIHQVANFKTCSTIPTDGFLYGLNSLLPADIAIKNTSEVDPDFHARYCAKEKVYLYRILYSPHRRPLKRLYSWTVRRQLDLKAMEDCLPALYGEHDFGAFMASGSSAKSAVRKITDVKLTAKGSLIEFEIAANGFLRHMVRNIVGTLVEVGHGEKTPDMFSRILKETDRTKAGPTAPPQGLFLKDVIYSTYESSMNKVGQYCAQI